MKTTPNKIKADMGKNTTLFIKGKRTKTAYLKRDDVLHNRLFKILKRNKK